jgi:hypothetical protein
MAKSIRVSLRETAPERVVFGGGAFRVQLPKAELPRSLTVEYDPGRRIYRIRLHYLGEEPSVRESKNCKGVLFEEGRYSGNIHSISVPVVDQRLGFAPLSSTIRTALAERVKGLEGVDMIGRKLNRLATAQMFEDKDVVQALESELTAPAKL